MTLHRAIGNKLQLDYNFGDSKVCYVQKELIGEWFIFALSWIYSSLQSYEQKGYIVKSWYYHFIIMNTVEN